MSLKAGESAYGLGYAGTYSNNVTHVPLNKRSEWVHSWLAGYVYAEQTPEVRARLLSRAEYRDYSKNVFSDQTLVNVNASAAWVLSPQRFSWAVDDTFTQTRIDALAADTPANQTDTNVFSTGPDFTLRFSPTHSVYLGARYGNVYTEDSNADNDRKSGYARWEYQTSPQTLVSLNYEALDVQYDDNVANNDYRRQSYFFRYTTLSPQTEISFDLGATDIDLERGNDLNGRLARFSWTRRVTPESSFGLSAGAEYSDTGSEVLASSRVAEGQAVEAPQGQTTTVVTGDVYFARSADFYYTRRTGRVNTLVRAFTQDIDYDTTAQDREEYGGYLNVGYSYSDTLTATLSAERIETEYRNFVRQDSDSTLGGDLEQRLNRHVSIGFGVRRLERASTSAAVEYVEHRALFTIGYASNPLLAPLPGR